MDPTDALTRALSDWLASVLSRFDAGRLKAMERAMHADQCDMHVRVHLREGIIIVEGIDCVRALRTEICRAHVAPFRPDRGIATLDSGLKER
jgi:hypothetical protein